MEEFKATFEIESKTDAYAVERLMERLYDSVREESRSIRADADDASATLDQFKTLRDAARRPAPGRLTVVYERRDQGFED